MTFHVRLRPDQRSQDIRESSVQADSQGAARRKIKSGYPDCVIVSVTDPLHAKRVEVAQALSGIAAYSKDPRVKAIAVFSKPVAELAVSIGEEVERQVNAGVRSALNRSH